MSLLQGENRKNVLGVTDQAYREVWEGQKKKGGACVGKKKNCEKRESHQGDGFWEGIRKTCCGDGSGIWGGFRGEGGEREGSEKGGGNSGKSWGGGLAKAKDGDLEEDRG